MRRKKEEGERGIRRRRRRRRRRLRRSIETFLMLSEHQLLFLVTFW